ncbi:Hpt protein [Magnetococcus marinus MC-1]|uniref:Hpt protein n=1 Tax=Magnetococcus marinus (strain ATCC BAA-1437 / JCM 17883 / MC-1) TaxID=156889 RepID=A0L7S6_MAGMM|nr:Hpt domain-containing protein [Magnetococcus marinus]ABK44019.1 Hpt protein [Magnetococcus marinus MC-1]
MSDPIKVVIDEDLEDIVPGYLENRRKDIQDLEKSLLDDDFETASILGHRMKGSGAGYGFDQITEIGRDIEIAAKNSNKEGIAVGVTQLKDYLERVEIRYE